MRTSYDRQTDAGAIWLVDTGASDSGSVNPDLVFDYDDEDRIVGIEFLHASAHLPGPTLPGEGKLALTVFHSPRADYLELGFVGGMAIGEKREVLPGVTLLFDQTETEQLVGITFSPASKILAQGAPGTS